MVSRRRSSRDCWLRKEGGERRGVSGRIWSLPIRVWRRRLSKFGVEVELNELILGFGGGGEIGRKGFRKLVFRIETREEEGRKGGGRVYACLWQA